MLTNTVIKVTFVSAVAVAASVTVADLAAEKAVPAE